MRVANEAIHKESCPKQVVVLKSAVCGRRKGISRDLRDG